MFSFRRKSKLQADPPRIRSSPSLPQLNSPGIPWPENLVDVSSIRKNPVDSPLQGATKTSFQGVDLAPIPFHKPFRPSTDKRPDGGPISSLYMAHSPSMLDDWKTTPPKSAGRYSQRRNRIPPTFNLMVAGSQGTGKTSLLRLLLETADISPTATPDQRAAVDRFLRGPLKNTQAISTACVEICESRFDRVLFSVIDTPGLDFIEGRELKLERQVNNIIKYIDAQYADTMNEESKVIRKNKGDQHIHLCIYLIDPSSIMTVAARRAQSSLPLKTRSETTLSNRNPPDLVPDTSSGDESDDEEEPLTMFPGELRVLRRLSARCNVLPVIARADSLTDDKLDAVKEAVRRGLAEAGLDFGVFGPSEGKKKQEQEDNLETPKRQTRFSAPSKPNGDTNGTDSSQANGDDGSESEEERQSRPVIKLRPQRHRALSRSRSRRDLSQAADDDRRPVSPDAGDTESVANVRFSAHIVGRVDLLNVMPFAIIAPEMGKRKKYRHKVTDSEILNTAPSSPVQQSEDGHAPSVDTTPATPMSLTTAPPRTAFLDGPPEALHGVFTRKFRWGTVDVLDPKHCDFSALRTAVLSTHLKVLKTQTKEVLYEKYRTEKLLARRATSQITDEERNRLLQELGL